MSLDVKQVYLDMKKAGERPSSLLKTAAEAEDSKRQASQCIRQTSTQPEKLLSQLENGTYRSGGSTSVMNSCAKMYVLMHLNAVVMREAAVGVACWAAQ